ncbi:MAG TPA: hypothetical protein VFD70_22375 [Anaerolineae bacterium]|nr:hypothetical protein [Anaerolineae bacterium]
MRGIVEGIVKAEETAAFLEGYGDLEVDARALVYYRYAWAVQDMTAYGESVFLVPALHEETRRDAVQRFTSLFENGGTVSIAVGSDEHNFSRVV